MRTLVIGDVHGSYKALRQALDRAQFNPMKDRLISLGDICDGYPEVKECVEYLSTLPHLVFIMSNHDWWFREWILKDEVPAIWYLQGGHATLESYSPGFKALTQVKGKTSDNPIVFYPKGKNVVVPAHHQRLFLEAPAYHVEGKQVFVHGGIDPGLPMEQQDADMLLWDRDLVCHARLIATRMPEYRFGEWEDIFVGHTQTTSGYFGGGDKPLHFCNVRMIDTGSGWSGRLTVMDIKTKAFWQSEPSCELYGRQAQRRPE